MRCLCAGLVIVQPTTTCQVMPDDAPPDLTRPYRVEGVPGHSSQSPAQLVPGVPSAPLAMLENGVYARLEARTVLIRTAADVQRWAAERFGRRLRGGCCVACHSRWCARGGAANASHLSVTCVPVWLAGVSDAWNT